MTTVRLGTADDWAAAGDVFAASSGARRGCAVPAEERERIVDRLESGWLLVAEDDGEMVGIAAGYDGRTDDGAGSVVSGLCHLSLVFVHPSRWGRGIGAALVDRVLTEAAARGYRRIQLWTHENNERAHRLYASRQFRRDGRTKDDGRGEVIGLWSRDVPPIAADS